MKILLGVTGSISAYKSIDIARYLQNQGHVVKVVFTKGALNFLNPKIFDYFFISYYTSSDDFNHNKVLHIELARWADLVAIVPCSANTLARLSHGFCDDLLTSIWLSLKKEVTKVIFPSMNTEMYENVLTKINIDNVQGVSNNHTYLPNCYVVEPDSGLLACGEDGLGKLPDAYGISELIPTFKNTFTKNTHIKKIVITAGATISCIDDVRYITNPAKGGTSYLLAKKYLSEGYEVHVIKGKNVIPEFKYLEKHPRYSSKEVTTTLDLFEHVNSLKNNFDVYISPMAVGDVIMEYTEGKIKKSSMNNHFNFTLAPDVLDYVVKNKKEGQMLIGFGAETNLSPDIIEEKIKRKPVDLLIVNEVNNGLSGKDKIGFGTNENTYHFIQPNHSNVYMIKLNKQELVDNIFDFTIKNIFSISMTFDRLYLVNKNNKDLV